MIMILTVFPKESLTTFEKQLFILKDRDNIDIFFAGDDVETKNKKCQYVNMFTNGDNPYKKVITPLLRIYE